MERIEQHASERPGKGLAPRQPQHRLRACAWASTTASGTAGERACAVNWLSGADLHRAEPHPKAGARSSTPPRTA